MIGFKSLFLAVVMCPLLVHSQRGGVRAGAFGNPNRRPRHSELKLSSASYRRLGGGKESSSKTSSKGAGYNVDNQLTSDVFDLLSTPRSEISSFLTKSGTAIPELSQFMEMIRGTANTTEEKAILDRATDEEFLVILMAPNAVSGDGERLLQSVGSDFDYCPESVIGRVSDVLVETMDFVFSKASLFDPKIFGSVFGGLGQKIGQSFANKLLAGPRGRSVFRRIFNDLATKEINGSTFASLFSLLITETGGSFFLDVLGDAGITGLDIFLFGVGIAATIAATAYSGGAALAARFVSFGLSSRDWVLAMLNLQKGCPSEAPSEAPSARPSVEPTDRPSNKPTRMPSPPTNAPTPRLQGRTSGVFGDPHLSTFDRLRFACQASGEFVMITSLETPDFSVQERFVSVGSDQCSQASVSAGVTVSEPGFPIIQLSLPRTDEISLASGTVSIVDKQCAADLYVDGVAQGSLTFADENVRFEATDSLDTRFRILFPSTGFEVRPSIRYSEAFGCHLNVQVFLPLSYRADETLLGLLGTPNGVASDDWITPTGESYSSVPQTSEDTVFAPSYNYCTTQWCIRNEDDTKFTYRSGESFMNFNRCDEDYGTEIEAAIEGAIDNQNPIVDLCGPTNLFCILDGVCGGGVEDALAALVDEEEIALAQDLSNDLITVPPVPLPDTKKSSKSSSSKGSKDEHRQKKMVEQP